MNQPTQNSINQPRGLSTIVDGLPASDGAGVRLTRLLGAGELAFLDPFLLLDAFGSDSPDDYLPGFPSHPHRGFETVTYLLAGRMRHRDSAGHEGVIEPGGVQWMTAGRGIVHSEMPEQEQGRLAGFQLWINLPAVHKMDAPVYQEFPAGRIPEEHDEHGLCVRVIAGATDRGTLGPVRQPLTEPLYLDVSLPAGRGFAQGIPEGHNAMLYVIDGELGWDSTRLGAGRLGVLGAGGGLLLPAQEKASRFLLMAGRPLGEPLARGGPFVMNTREEVQQAFQDYAAGRF